MLSLVLALSLSQWPQHRIFDQPNLRLLNGDMTPTYLEFLPESGAGLPQISHHNTALCDALAAEVPTWNTPVDGGAGNWCLGGDGLAVTGSQVTFATFGTPSTIDTPVCPSGLDCLAATGQPIRALQLNGTSQYTQAETSTSPSDALTMCAWYRTDGRVKNYSIIDKNNGAVAGEAGPSILFVPGSFNQFNVCKTNASCTALAGGPQPQLVPTLSCMTYKYVTDGTSVLRGYENGAQSIASTTAVGPLQDNAATPFRVGARNYTGVPDYMGGEVFGAFYVDQELSAAQIAAISRRVLADVPKAVIRGGQSTVDLTYTRTGARFCAKADNTGSIVPANRPCIAQNGILVEATATNLLLRSQELNSSPWTVAYVTATANYGQAPDGTKTAERIVGGVTAGLFQGGLNLSATSVFSVYVKGVSGFGNVCPYAYNGNLGQIDTAACAYNPDTWTRCVLPSNDANVIEVGFLNAAQGGCTPTANYDVLLWGAQVETGSVATSYVPTTSASAVRATDAIILNTGLSSPFPISIAAQYTPWDGTNITAYKHLLEWYRSGGSRDALMVCPAGNTIGFEGGGSGCYLPVPYGVPASDIRLSLAYSAASVPLVSFCVGSNCSSGVLSTSQPATGTTMFLAPHFYAGAVQAPGSFVWSKVCLDPRPSRCR